MTLETKPIAQLKKGVWVNREKLREVLDKVSFMYGFLLIVMAVFSFFSGRIFMGVFQIVMSLPLWLIQYSYSRFKKEERGNAKQD